jgi:hypothetical protein
MTASHSNPHITAMIKELPMRSDLEKMPLDSDPEIAAAQLLIRQAVPVPQYKKLMVKIRALVKSMLN